MDQLSDLELIKLVLVNKGTSFRPFELLLSRHENYVYNFCLRYFKNEQIAEDLTQDIFLKVFNKLSSYSGKSEFKFWLYTLTSNACSDYYRANKKNTLLSKEMAVQAEFEKNTVSGLYEENERNLPVAIEKLPSDERQAILMFYFSDLTVKQIADELGLGESAIKMRIHRAREKLGIILNEAF